MAQMNLVDIHPIDSTNLGVYREPFDRVVDITGFTLWPVAGSNFVWDFQHPGTLERGRLLHVEGFLKGGSVALNHRGQAYVVTRQDFSLALLFPSTPRRISLGGGNYKILPKDSKKAFPAGWPRALISQIVRARFRTVVIINEAFLLEKIGLRSGPAL
ncbi:MAG: hypothetical protein V3S29_09250 [bacterium]